jgi:uncharacterized protein YecE (DUF72 family)
MELYVGCPIWSFRGWIGNFYPKGAKPSDFLHEYSRRLTTIEGNTTFYAVPAQKTIEQWVAETPETFRFCPKVPRAISHDGDLMEHVAATQEFVNVMRQLGKRLGPMFLQLPPHYLPGRLKDLSAFLADWPKEVRLGVEVRHLDWFDAPHNETLNELLAKYNMARVVIDTRPIRNLKGDKALEGSTYESLLQARERKPDVPILPERTTDFVYVRYIGHPQPEMNDELLDEWAGYFSVQLRSGADVYAICHSPENLTAPLIARSLYQRIAAQVPVPPLPWDAADEENFEQGQLL